jgi:hypothetical protein
VAYDTGTASQLGSMVTSPPGQNFTSIHPDRQAKPSETIPRARMPWSRRAITLEDPFIGGCREVVIELEMALAITFCRPAGVAPFAAD